MGRHHFASTGFSILLVLAITFCYLGSGTAAPQVGLAQPPLFPQRLSLTGSWRFMPAYLSPASQYLPNIDDTQWQQIQVPSNWFLQGLDLSGAVWYRHRFTADSRLKNKVVKLVFEGVDYAADVWLNGQYLGFHEGYFQPFSFLVSDLLHLDAENVLVVRVDSPYEEPGRVWSLHKRLIKGIFNHHDTRPGNAWSLRGQEQNSGGIWAPVYLQVSEQLAIDKVRVTPQVNLDTLVGVADVQLAISYSGTTSKEFQFRLQLVPDNFSGAAGSPILESRTLQPGANQLRFQVPSRNTQLWSPWERGEPNLYHLAIAALDTNQILDQTETIFGFRTVEFQPDSQIFLINGERFFLRGTNYISSQWLSEMTPEKYAADIDLMKQANINAIRVHAHIEAQTFYQLCDAAGIMVWQDFPLQWGYTDDPAFIAEATNQALDMVTVLYNHPSIIAWSLHNEPPWDADWMKYKYPDYNPNQNRELDDTLFASLTAVDPTRYLHKYSSTAEHPWLGWYSGSFMDYAKPSKEALIAEFGAQALPNLVSLRKIFSADEVWPDTDAKWEKWSYHNFQRRETFEIAKVSMGDNLQEFIDNTQQYQAKLTQFAAESYRRQRFQPVTSIFQFMFVENWPSVNWGIVDYWRRPKPGYEALKFAYQPVLPSIAWEKDVWLLGDTVSVDLWIINDLRLRFTDSQLIYTLLNQREVVENHSVNADIEPDSGKKMLTLRYERLSPGDYQLIVKVADNSGRVLGENEFQFKVALGSGNEKKE